MKQTTLSFTLPISKAMDFLSLVERLDTGDGSPEETENGFKWDQRERPDAAYLAHLRSLPDAALLDIFKSIHQATSGLMVDVMNRGGFSRSLTSAVLQGNRRNAEIDKVIVEVIRERLAYTPKTSGEEVVTEAQPREPIVVNFSTTPPKLKDLLRDNERKAVSFAIERNGTFYNKDLAEVLGVVDLALTSTTLGHVTRKLRKVGALGMNESDWYTKHRTPNGTLLTVREDVMEVFRDVEGLPVPEAR